MKIIHLIVISFSLLICSNVYGQGKLIDSSAQFPTGYGVYTFPLNSKILLEIREKENNKTQYEYRILSIESIEGFYSFKQDKNILSTSPQKNTIELFFMGAYYNEGKEDKDYKSVLILRNNSEIPLSYKADIKYYYSKKFENTSVMSLFPQTKGREIWGHKIDFITLYDFEKFK
nr:hypothetical protein [uncultured Chryseobacterium sp.]